MWRPDSYLEEAVNEGDMLSIKVALTTYMQKDPAARDDIRRALQYIRDNVEGFKMDEHDGRSFRAKEDWDKDYIAKLIGQFMDNFSQERFEHLLDVGETLYSKPKAISKGSVSNSKRHNTRNNNRVTISKKEEGGIKKLINLLLIGVGIIGGGVLLLKLARPLINLIRNNPLLIVLGMGIIMLVIYLIQNRRR
ncbi:hypothetical protein [Halonatronum saccharophilum]|uniref:hypothetical protein n=1 Tax=Halonatronum saccharophilum TaxID=150060 RepID=UPI00047F95E9|nr:hypothetical protein [Halonatronum saccharophilum]